MLDTTVRYRLVRRPRDPVAAPDLDESQRAVLQHAGGPLLVLAGPGTGKTTTLVEAVVDRVERRGLAPHQVLVLTFSRKAAEELRDRITGRLARTVATPLSSTFHSFCYALVRRFQPPEAFARPLQLLSAPEQDLRIRELLAGSRDSGHVRWPPALDAALRTRGLAEEVRTVLARARERSLDPDDLRRAGAAAGRAEWSAVGDFFDEYLDVLDAQHVVDYAELVHRAMLLVEQPAVQAILHSELRAVFVDEFQDTDPVQVRLLQALAGGGRDLVAFGDPDQSIYGFRGADVRGILRFPQDFRRSDGAPADVVALTATRRFGARLLVASRRVAAGLGLPGSIDRAVFEAFRSPASDGCPYGDGRVEAFTCSSSGAELDHVADLLRRARLEDDVPWSQMAVLVRSGVRSIPPLRRALVSAGVPVAVGADEIPLRCEPAVQPLLLALRVAADPAALTPEAARALLLSPLGDLDAGAVRRLARLLRADAAGPAGQPPHGSSDELLVQALGDPAVLATERDDAAVKAHRVARLLARARATLQAGEPAEQALWSLWAGTTWPRRMRAAVDRGGAAARSAHRDLDAVCALFELAARAEERSEHRGARSFLAELESQQVPGDTLADRGSRGDAVRVLTAHRAKGLEWRVVVVTGVQEDVWPDLRRRGSLLQADRLGGDGLRPPVSAAQLLAEERRLFYVAVTRARERLVVTAVRSPDTDGDQPSRLLDELGVPVTHRSGRPARPLSLSGVVGALRRVATDPATSPALRRAAAARLARLADEQVGGEPLVPQADPSSWWGLHELTEPDTPVRPAEQPLALSGSAVAGLGECPLRWFLAREAAGQSAGSSAQGFGKVVHVLAEAVASGRVAPDVDVLSGHLDAVWPRLQFAARWVADRERAVAEQALRRFVAWHTGRPGRDLLAAEHRFEVTVPVTLPDGRVDHAHLRGSIDRLEVADDGSVV
ncbi:MAG: ATP-dependent helicase, partial [Actinomycetota bacterium]|nr:ATP-dependent helicase [Actinomycetota bacterium]